MLCSAVPMKSEKSAKKLTPEEFHILRETGTEPAYSGKYLDHKKKGVYTCAGCGKELFSAKDKFDSGTGWPSFTQPVSEENIETKADFKFIIPRTEVRCKQCGGHLGHVFKDGPKPTGLRYCIYSAALHFKEKK